MRGGSNNSIALWAVLLTGVGLGVLGRYVFDYARSSGQNAAAVTAVAAVAAIVITLASSVFRS